LIQCLGLGFIIDSASASDIGAERLGAYLSLFPYIASS